MSYTEYLKLNTLLSCQKPETDMLDEMLFVITHQTTELWFKQLLYEIDEIVNTNVTLDKINRVILILKHITQQFSILETMGPVSFSTFRSKLGCASGLQSVQFRYLESIMGFENVNTCSLTQVQKDVIKKLNNQNLFKKIDEWLSLMNFNVVDIEIPIEYVGRFSEKSQKMIIYIFTHSNYNTGMCREILLGLLLLDQAMTMFRYKHVQLVRYTIGIQTGTGGTHNNYLDKTLSKDLFSEISTLITFSTTLLQPRPQQLSTL
jgi:tryptophan 2,3-dioxygenase